MGASAGGIEALKKIAAHLPADLRAVVLIGWALNEGCLVTQGLPLEDLRRRLWPPPGAIARLLTTAKEFQGDVVNCIDNRLSIAAGARSSAAIRGQ
jgi:hypothetical protein